MKKVLQYTVKGNILHYIFAILIILSACKKETTEEIQYSYIVDYEKLTSYNRSYISIIFNQAGKDEPTVLELKDSIKYGVDVYKLEYQSNFNGEDKNASGIICMPASKGEFPIISFQNGTYTAHDLAPSENYSGSIFMVVAALASHGYIILVPDYFGYGVADDVVHPYYEKESSNSSILDMINASYELLDVMDEEATYSDNLYLMGYSQGGWASMAALQAIENNTDINFQVKAASCGAGAYNLKAVSEHMLALDSFPSPLYLPFFVYSHQQYGTLLNSPLELFFQEPYASSIPELFDGTYTRNEINNELNRNVPELLTENLLNNFNTGSEFASLRSELVKNSIKAFSTNSLIRIYHGNADKNVPYSESENMLAGFAALNLSHSVEFITLENMNHTSGVLPWGVETIKWFNTLESN